MNAVGKIATLFDNDITRQIEEVIKVDQTSETSLPRKSANTS